MTKEIVKTYQDIEIAFTNEGWFNATKAATRFGKEPYSWLRQKDTKQYIAAVQKITAAKTVIRTKRNSGTWMHPKLGVAFARWLDVEFAIWCDFQIDAILRGTIDVKRARHQASSSYKLMQDILKLKREGQGKLTRPHHYINEARLINWCLTGQYTKLDRDSLPIAELDLLAALEERNALLISAEVGYSFRKEILKEFVEKLNMPAIEGTKDDIRGVLET